MRVAVTGGRNFNDYRLAHFAYVAYVDEGDVVIHGGAFGLDNLFGMIAQRGGSEVEVYRADWKHEGRAAGALRNQQMIDSGVDLLLAFPGGVGTADMVARARRAGIKVIHVTREVSNGD
jgi:hypothetical protein